MRLIGCFVLALFLIGCATSQKYNQRLNSWVGSSADDLVVRNGAPTNIVDLGGGGQMLEYRSKHIGVAGNWLWCNTRFVTDRNNVIQEWNYEGNDCKAK